MVCSYYHSLSASNSMFLPWKLVWRSKVLPRVASFSWAASLGKILSFENLRKRDYCIGLVLHVKGVGSLWIIFFFIVQ